MVSIWLKTICEQERSAYHKVNVGWAHWVTIQQLKKNTSWSVGWERVRSWLEAVEPVLALGKAGVGAIGAGGAATRRGRRGRNAREKGAGRTEKEKPNSGRSLLSAV